MTEITNITTAARHWRRAAAAAREAAGYQWATVPDRVEAARAYREALAALAKGDRCAYHWHPLGPSIRAEALGLPLCVTGDVAGMWAEAARRLEAVTL